MFEKIFKTYGGKDVDGATLHQEKEEGNIGHAC